MTDEGRPGSPEEIQRVIEKTAKAAFDCGRGAMYRGLREKIEQLFRNNTNPSKAEILAIFDAEIKQRFRSSGGGMG